MTSIRWIKRGLKIDFLKIKNIATILSVIAIISSLFFLVYKNLNFGIPPPLKKMPWDVYVVNLDVFKEARTDDTPAGEPKMEMVLVY